MNDNDFHGEFDGVVRGDLCRPWISAALRPGRITASIFMVITSTLSAPGARPPAFKKVQQRFGNFFCLLPQSLVVI